MYNTSEVKDIQNNLLILLKDFDHFCRAHEIKYSLIGGSLIGAIREKGFLKWDDDADIIMERVYFEKLLSICSSRYSLNRHLWVPRLTLKNTDKTELIRGFYIDILILDKMPRPYYKHRLKLLLLKMLQGTLKKRVEYKKFNLKGKILSFITSSLGRFFSQERKLKWYDKMAKWGYTHESDFLCSYTDQYRYLDKVFSAEIVSSYIDVDFENTKLMSMSGYDSYLRINFGDYMTPPPIEMQIPEHGDI